MTLDRPVPELDALVREIVDAATRVHTTLGPGFLESIYARALLSELRVRGFATERERQIKIWYGSQVVGKPQPRFDRGERRHR